jgi:hypothetical protein
VTLTPSINLNFKKKLHTSKHKYFVILICSTYPPPKIKMMYNIDYVQLIEIKYLHKNKVRFQIFLKSYTYVFRKLELV